MMTFKCFRFVSLLLSRKKKKKKKQNGVVLVFHLFITERSWPSTKIHLELKKHKDRKERKKEREDRLEEFEQKKPQKQVHTKK